MTFKTYAAYYDSIYETKDYPRECNFLEQVFAQHSRRSVRSVLDLGCGTGGHVLPLAARGYEVVGVDKSESMLAEARRKAAQLGPVETPPEFAAADVQSVSLGRRFDAVVAMFAVVSYQTTNAGLLSMFRAARAHLEPGGLFVFDAWFGPAVLKNPPTERLKEVQSGAQRLLRFARPDLDLLKQVVTVRYILMRLEGGKVTDEVREDHEMRFLFPGETSFLLDATGFKLTSMCPFLQLHETLTSDDWNFTVIAEAV